VLDGCRRRRIPIFGRPGERQAVESAAS